MSQATAWYLNCWPTAPKACVGACPPHISWLKGLPFKPACLVWQAGSRLQVCTLCLPGLSLGVEVLKLGSVELVQPSHSDQPGWERHAWDSISQTADL